jgi:hypothetical protein
VAQIREMNEAQRFKAANGRQFTLLTDHYKFSNYQENIKRFYLGQYTFS